MIDISKQPEVIAAINTIINNGGVAEVKKEKWKSGDKTLVVEQIRMVRKVFPPETNK